MGTPAASLAHALRRFEGADWVRWGVLAVPTLFAISNARPWSWPLIGLVLVLSVPALWLTRESRPRWLMPATMIAVVTAAGALWILQPGSWTSTTMFGATFYTLRVSGRIAAGIALAVASAAILVWSIAYQLDWLNVVSSSGSSSSWCCSRPTAGVAPSGWNRPNSRSPAPRPPARNTPARPRSPNAPASPASCTTSSRTRSPVSRSTCKARA